MILKQIFQIGAGCAASRDGRATWDVERKLAYIVVTGMAVNAAPSVPWIAEGRNTIAVVHGKTIAGWWRTGISTTRWW